MRACFYSPGDGGFRKEKSISLCFQQKLSIFVDVSCFWIKKEALLI